MKRACALALLSVFLLLVVARQASSVEPSRDATTVHPAAQVPQSDFFWFGGTHWDAGDARWEANVGTDRSNAWTFDSGVGGPLEGWTSRDRTVVPLPTVPVGNPDNADFRWTHRSLYLLYATPGTDLFPAATPPDTGGIWCAKYEVEADELCWVAGQGGRVPKSVEIGVA